MFLALPRVAKGTSGETAVVPEMLPRYRFQMLKRLGPSLLWGALWGMAAWQAYAIVEYAATTLLPLLLYKNMVIAEWHWKLSLTLFGFFTVAGIVAGGIGAVLFAALKKAPLDHRDYKALGTLTLVLAFVANLLKGDHEASTFMVAILLAGMVIWSFWPSTWSKRLSLLVNPWGASLLLLTVGRVNYDMLNGRSVFIRAGVSIALISGFAAVSILATGIRRKTRAGGLLKEGAAVACGAMVVLGSAVLMNPNIHAQVESAARQNGSKPNVILVTMDTVRADHLSLYGYNRNTTPNLAQLAQSSTVFTHAMAAGDMTLTSHAAIFTGTYGSWNGAHPDLGNRPHSISDQYATLPEILAKNGYSTAAIVANIYYLQPALGFSRGFQLYELDIPVRLLPGKDRYYLRDGARQVLSRFRCTSEFDLPIRRAQEINQAAFRFLKAGVASQQKPFFLFLNYMDAHNPYLPPAPFDAMYPGKDCSVTNDEWTLLSRGLAAHKTQLPEHVRDELVSQYDGAIAYLDSQIGALILELKRLGVYDNTMIVITSDHGEALGDRDRIGHGVSTYHDQVGVPLIIKYPAISTSQVVTTNVGHADILPTILEAAGIAAPRFIRGESLQGGSSVSRTILSESFPDPLLSGPGGGRTERAIYSGAFKYIGSTAGKHELYDLLADPDEQRDVCSAQSARCAEMQNQLDQLARTAPKDRSPGKKLDPQSMERLKSLRIRPVRGYVQ